MTLVSCGRAAAGLLLAVALSACSSGNDATSDPSSDATSATTAATAESDEPTQSVELAASSPLAELDWRENFPDDSLCSAVGDVLSAETGVKIELKSSRVDTATMQCALRSDDQPNVEVGVLVERLPTTGRLESGEPVDLADAQAYADHYVQLGFEADQAEAEAAGASLALYRFDGDAEEAAFVGGENVISLSLTSLPATRSNLSATVGAALNPGSPRGPLTVHEVVNIAAPGSEPTEQGNQVLDSTDGSGTYEIGPVIIPSEDITLVEPVKAPDRGAEAWVIEAHLTPQGADTWAAISEHACFLRPEMPLLALVVGERIVSAPMVSNCDAIEKVDVIQISGSWDQAGAEAFADGISQSG